MKHTIKFFKNAKRWLLVFWLCKLWGYHEWTSPADRNEPVPKDINPDNCHLLFYLHCKMTCIHCGEEAEPSKRMYQRIMRDYANAGN